MAKDHGDVAGESANERGAAKGIGLAGEQEQHGKGLDEEVEGGAAGEGGGDGEGEEGEQKKRGCRGRGKEEGGGEGGGVEEGRGEAEQPTHLLGRHERTGVSESKPCTGHEKLKKERERHFASHCALMTLGDSWCVDRVFF